MGLDYVNRIVETRIKGMKRGEGIDGGGGGVGGGSEVAQACERCIKKD
jgi:hypothetical protein